MVTRLLWLFFMVTRSLWIRFMVTRLLWLAFMVTWCLWLFYKVTCLLREFESPVMTRIAPRCSVSGLIWWDTTGSNTKLRNNSSVTPVACHSPKRCIWSSTWIQSISKYVPSSLPLRAVTSASRIRATTPDIETVHYKQKAHDCAQCNKGFGQAGTLRGHIAKVHSEARVEVSLQPVWQDLHVWGRVYPAYPGSAWQ